jgi:phosphatidylglycerophosphate synthase
VTNPEPSEAAWKTKPTDRFVLKWIKCNLSARITPSLTGLPWLRPWMITIGSCLFGLVAGGAFALGWGFAAGLIALIAQVLDGVDGQFARLTGTQSPAGALLDSTLDRYADGALMIGMLVYIARLPSFLAPWQFVLLAFLALAGAFSVSFTSARAANLGMEAGGNLTLAGKGTRTSVMALSGLLSPLWPMFPVAALFYLALHPNLVVAGRLIRGYRQADR